MPKSDSSFFYNYNILLDFIIRNCFSLQKFFKNTIKKVVAKQDCNCFLKREVMKKLHQMNSKYVHCNFYF